MVKPILLAIASWCILPVSYGCDMCGCNMNNQYLGVLPSTYPNFVGLQYTYNYYKAADNLPVGSRLTKPSFTFASSVQLSGRYSINRRFYVMAFVPYILNNGQENGKPFRINGIGDVTIVGGYKLLDGVTPGKLTHTLLLNAGVKMPTGEHKPVLELDNKGLPNIQAGTGSWDGIVNANYTIWRKNTGLNTDAGITLTTTDKYRVKQGNMMQAGVVVARKFNRGSLVLLPQAGARWEYAQKDYDDYKLKYLNSLSGRNVLFASAGIQAYYKKLGARMLVNLPAHQKVATGTVTVHTRYEGVLFYPF